MKRLRFQDAFRSFRITSIAWPITASLCVRCLSTAALNITVVTSDNGLPARSVQWTDASGQPRTAIMVDQRPQGAGFLRRFTYQVGGVSRVCTGTGANGHQGDGYVQNHTAAGPDFSSHFVAGTTTVVLAAAHHAILSYDMPTYSINGNVIPTTVQWFFAEGRSDPIFALCQDARATAGNIGADTRTPYGDVDYSGGIDATVGGASFGDTYKFITLAANPEQVTRNSGWRYNEINTIPYAMQWADPAQVDAEMGHVATLPISVQDQGSDPRTFPTVDTRGTQQPNGPMIDDENWAYQILNYVLPPLPGGGPTSSKRLTWGSNWGLPGGFDNYGDNSLNVRQYSQHASSHNGAFNGTRADGMLLAYSVFVVFGTHSGGYLNGTVGQMVKQMENAAAASLSAVTGSVKTSGPAGVGNASSTTRTYTPAGYNPTYSTWEVVAAANTVDATLTPSAGKSLDHPVFVVNGYTLAQLPITISVGPGLVTPDVDYFATLDAVNQRLWITVNRSSSSAVNLKVTPGGGGGQQPSITSFPASGTVGTSIIITGNNFSGATAVAFNGMNATFTIDSPTQITAVVPLNATTGTISITTPAGTGTSATSFTPLAAQRPTLTLKPGTGAGGLKIIAGPAQYDRQNIATDTTSNDYGWILGGPALVTYSITISEFPPQANLGFQAHMFLVPNSSGSTAPDYDDSSVIMLDIQTQASGNATAWFRYKVNRPGDNAFIYAAGTLGQVDCATGPLGTWSLSFTANTSMTMTAPNGNSTQLNFPDPAAIQPAFGSKVTAYFGNQANDVSQVGQSSVFSRIRINGTPRAQPIDETFPGPDLNQHPSPVTWQWVKIAVSPSGILIPASSDGLVLTWTLPDTGFVLQFSPSLAPPAWSDLNLPNILTQGNTKIVNVSRSALPNNARGFIRMIQR